MECSLRSHYSFTRNSTHFVRSTSREASMALRIVWTWIMTACVVVGAYGVTSGTATRMFRVYSLCIFGLGILMGALWPSMSLSRRVRALEERSEK